MTVTLSDIFLDVNDKVRNTTSGSLNNDIRARAVNRVLEDLQVYADWKFTKRVKQFYFLEGISEYNLKDYVGCTCFDKDGSSEILDFKNPYDLRPTNQADKSLTFHESKEVRENIRRNKFIGEYSIENGTLIIGYFRQISSELHNCDSLSANGTVVASGDASNVTIDEIVKSKGSGSLNFDVSAGQSLVITFNNITRKDLETLQNKSALTLDVWLPTITNFTSIQARWGSDNTNYWSKTESTPAGKGDLETGKNTFAFRWAEATETGSPDVNNVDYLQIIITFSQNTTATDFRLDNIRIAQEVEMEIEYYSKAMAKKTTGEYQLGFNTSILTDKLLGDDIAKRCVIQGAVFELFERIGGKSERDRSDSFKIYDDMKRELLKGHGVKIRRETKILNFPGRQRRHGLRD